MKLTSAIAIYFLIWSLTLFAVLPTGVRTARESGEAGVPGQADSAPQSPDLWRKAKLTTLISAILFALFYTNYVGDWIGMDDILPALRPPNS
jgi:predicted secreted protein